MQVRQVLIASILAATAVGAMSQEIDRSETLQARNLASQQVRGATTQARERASVVAEAGNVEASAPIKVAEQADTPAVAPVPNISWATRHATRPYAKTWLHGDRRQAHQVVVAERG